MRFVLAALALLAAPVLALQAAVNLGVTPSSLLRFNGFRAADVALARLQMSPEGSELAIVAPPSAIALARRSYALEPFASDALFVLAVAGADRMAAADEAILRRGQQLDPRSRPIAVALVQKAIIAADYAEALRQIDRLTRLSPGMGGQFAGVFASALADPEFLPLLKQALQKKPAWAEAFWSSVPGKDPELQNFLTVRQSTGVGTSAATDARLLQALLAAQKFEEALEFWLAGGAAGNDATAYLNSSTQPPLDWDLAQSGSINAALTADGALAFFIERGRQGTLARQLIRLTPGVYVFEGGVADSQGKGAVTASLECADTSARHDLRQTHAGEADYRWTVAPGSCEFAWLTLEGSAWNSSIPFRGELRGMAFERLAAD